MTAVNPVRDPDLRSPNVMTKRAWWLVGLNILIPGSAQILAGNRRLGRFGVGTTFLLWAVALLSLVVYLVAHPVFYTIVTNPIVLTVAQVALAGYAILWIVLTLDTLRLVRLIRAAPITRPFIAALAVLALVATAGGASYAAVTAGSARSALGQIFAGSTMAPPVNGRYNILLLGGDAGPDRTGLRPDSTSVASIDAATGATTIIGIPRNLEQIPFVTGSPLYGPFPNGYNCGDKCLIDYLYTYGEEHPSLYPKAVTNGSLPGIEAMRDAVEGVLGIKIQYFGLIDMQGFSDLVDALGGVTVDVPTRTPIGGVTGAKPTGWVEAGTQKMNGATALWYARTRYDSNDFERMARQRLVQEAIIKQFQPAIIVSKFQAIAQAGAQVVKTDVPSSALGGFVDLAEKSRKLPVAHLELVPPVVQPGNPDFSKIRQLVAQALAPKTATPAP
ncbi:LCP family protein [Lacisediminihabitans profunda]|uniref:LytR family transcriptional regulator n=1 Tax=Lacisediminihabitans profunda TaxID=2594790 RepID=A0A5C8UJL6_9MICO|nr:LCP family protein [Lacisediminihabitans profunda]TXN28256.1 LytR family transcriptional regulator [Lacisediminihabitans profunda]